MKRLGILALLVGLVLAPGLVPGTAADDPGQAIDSEAAKLVAEMADLLDQALYLAIAALSWPDRGDLTLYIQGVINLIDGPGSPDYDATGGATTPDGDGLKDLFLAFLTPRTDVETTEETYLSASLTAQVVQALEHTEGYLFLAAESAKDALDRVYSVTGGQEELRAMYAYLLAARGRTDDELILGGISALAEVFPALDLRVEPDLSLQAAIDRAPPGATIHLDPGTYRERIVIDKDITLVGAHLPDGETDRPATTITGPVWDFVVAVEGNGVEVHLQNLELSGGKSGMTVHGDNAVDLSSVWIAGVGTGIVSYGDATVVCDFCQITDCERALVVAEEGTAYVSYSVIAGCTATGVSVFSGGSLTMTDTTVRNCAPSGVYVQGDAALHLERCSILDSEWFGVSAYSAECAMHPLEDVIEEYGFTGTITGADNIIPGPDEEHGNLGGDVCPEAYRFLKEPGPVGVPSGGSIQAAIAAAVEGATVLLPEGIYRENLEIDKAITLRGEGSVVLTPASQDAPAIQVFETAGVELRNLEIEGATGIEIHTASCQVIDCSFRTTDVGASVIAFGADTVDFKRCAFAGEGVGVELVGDGNVVIDECRFSELSVGAMVGGMISATIRGSSFQECYEGVVLASSASATIEENRFRRCYASGIRVSEALDTSAAGSLVLNANSFTNGGEWDVTLCGLADSRTLAFHGSLSGAGNAVEGGYERLCPSDYDWPDGFLAE